MYKVETKEFTIKQRNGKSPNIHVTRTLYIPARRLKKTRSKKLNKPIDYGVTKEQFYQILDKASQPIKKPNKE